MDNLAPNYMRCAVHPEVKASNKETREVAHLITTASVDRAGDVVEPAGADVENFLKNPVVLRNHSYLTEDIIGKATSVEITKEGIWARTQFLDTPVGRDAFSLVSEGVGGWSIGFRPIEYDSIKDEKGRVKGFHFNTWEMLEYSQVAIPMNPDIVNGYVKRGLVSEENVHLFFQPTEQPTEQEPPAEPDDKSADQGPNAEPVEAAAHKPQPDNHGVIAALLDAARAEIEKTKREDELNTFVREKVRNQ